MLEGRWDGEDRSLDLKGVFIFLLIPRSLAVPSILY